MEKKLTDTEIDEILKNKYLSKYQIIQILNRYYHNLTGDPAQALVCDIKQALLEASDADVTSKQKGEWIYHMKKDLIDAPPFECSHCHFYSEEETKHCSECGTIMINV